MKSFAELEGVHAELHEGLLRHRDLVVGLEWGEALASLESFRTALDAHMEDEELLLLPVYARHVGDVRGGGAELFLLEHRNLRRVLDGLVERMRELADDPAAGRRQAHLLLDEEWMLLHLLDHHQRREHAVLYPELDRRLAPEERAAILGKLEQRRSADGDPHGDANRP